VDVNLKFNKPELQIEIDRLKANELGVSVLDISQTSATCPQRQKDGLFYNERQAVSGDRASG
jgi:multidrug efflux pump